MIMKVNSVPIQMIETARSDVDADSLKLTVSRCKSC